MINVRVKIYTGICVFILFLMANTSFGLQFADENQTLDLTPEEVQRLLVQTKQKSKAKAFTDRSASSDELQEDPYIMIDDMCFSVAMEADGSSSAFTGNKWTDGIVYYQFDQNVHGTNRQRFRNAAKEWANVADLTFIEGVGYGSYIHVRDWFNNSSYVGMMGGSQYLNMFNWSYKYIIVHEIGHALGLSHEHSRSDRDSYVSIIWSNIDDPYEHNFYLRSSINYGPYDFTSVMHYPRYAFATIPGTSTIEPKPAYTDFLYVMGQRSYLSAWDKEGMAAHYGYPNRLTASPSSLDYSARLVGESSTLRIVIQNFGDDSVSGSVTIAEPFHIVEGGMYNLANGATQVVSVAFQPEAEGIFSDNLSFSSGETVYVNGRGVTHADNDRDGASNYSEYIAGTDPENPYDVFSVTPLSYDVSGLSTFEIETKAGRSYQLQSTYNLVYMPWYNVGEEVTGNGTTIQLTAPSDYPQLMFRVVVNKID